MSNKKDEEKAFIIQYVLNRALVLPFSLSGTDAVWEGKKAWDEIIKIREEE